MDFIYLYKERYEGRTVMADDFQCDCFAESKRCHSSVTDEKVRREIDRNFGAEFGNRRSEACNDQHVPDFYDKVT